MPRPAFRFGWLTGPVLMLGAPSLAMAQGNIFNPYGNSGYADFREFGSPKYGTDPALPGQARIASGSVGSRYNTFDDYANSLDGGSDLGVGSGRPSSSNLPFYRAYQLDAQQARRAYRSTETSDDQAYRDRLAKRNAMYYQALATTDPKKRAELLREVDRMTQRDAVDRTRPSNAPSSFGRAGQAANRALPPPATRTAPAAGRTTVAPATRPATPAAARPAPTPPAAPGATSAAPATPPTATPTTNPASVPVPAPG